LTPTELALVDQMAELTGSKRTEVIKSALAVYHWFVRQALTGSRVVARKPTGEEVALETAELAVLEGKGNRWPFGAWPGSRKVLISSPSPQTVIPENRLYHGPSGTSGSPSSHFANSCN
jgi:hypothetical protein